MHPCPPSLLQWGDTALTLCIESGDQSSVQKLLERRPTPNTKGALLLAAQMGRAELISLLLQAGCPANEQDGLGCTPLHRAAEAHQSIAVRRLLDGGEEMAESGVPTPLVCSCCSADTDSPFCCLSLQART